MESLRNYADKLRNLQKKDGIIPLPRTSQERETLRYTWVEICFNEGVAKQADKDSKDFKKGLSWYASFRWSLDKKNSYLDCLLDVKGVEVEPVSKKEYQENYRVWTKWVRKYDRCK